MSVKFYSQFYVYIKVTVIPKSDTNAKGINVISLISVTSQASATHTQRSETLGDSGGLCRRMSSGCKVVFLSGAL